MRPSLSVEETVIALGHNLKATRLKRRVPQALLAERAGVSLSTLVKIEKGDCGVSIGTIASVINALGLGSPLSEIGAGADPLTQVFENDCLPKRIRSPRKL